MILNFEKSVECSTTARKSVSLCLWMLGLSCAALGGGAGDRNVFFEGFETIGEGGIYGALVGDEHLEVVDGEGVHGGRALMATYEGSERGSERVTNRFKLGELGLEYTLNYDVRFDDDFQFVKGGKLHGLGPDSLASTLMVNELLSMCVVDRFFETNSGSSSYLERCTFNSPLKNDRLVPRFDSSESILPAEKQAGCLCYS